MDTFDPKLALYTKRLLLARMRILYRHGFYGLLLMHMKYAVSEEVETACTDGERITFGIEFLNNLSDSELDFVMMHEILHVVLQHCFRSKDKLKELYNIAADIVVNSNILMENGDDTSSITLEKYGTAMHLAPNQKEGRLYTAEEVYEMFLSKSLEHGKDGRSSQGSGKGGKDKGKTDGSWDDHSQWENIEDENELIDVWTHRICDAAEAIKVREKTGGVGDVPLFVERMLKEFRNPQIDWRTILNSFIQEEIVDYSFFPPDRRFDGSPFFLPDFNEKEDLVANVLFMIDTSGSMSDKMITDAYSEVKGAVDQFNGKLKGWLGFFDASVIEPKPFEDDDSLTIIKPVGGGGTNFHVIFDYVRENMANEPPNSIIILTDGYAVFPPKEASQGIPVLWLINNEEVTPPWGKIARIKA